jgi:hypothetical protein
LSLFSDRALDFCLCWGGTATLYLQLLYSTCHVWLYFWDRLTLAIFARAGLEVQSSHLRICIAEIAGLYHYAHPAVLFVLFEESSILFFIMSVAIYVPTSMGQKLFASLPWMLALSFIMLIILL